MSRISSHSRYSALRAGQKQGRKVVLPSQVNLPATHLQINLGHLADSLSIGGKVGAYKILAEKLSSLAGVTKQWSWRYIAGVRAGTIAPSKKFIGALKLYNANIKPHQKQWFYFARRASVLAMHDKTMRAEILHAHLSAMGYKLVTHARYVEIKRRATKKRSQ